MNIVWYVVKCYKAYKRKAPKTKNPTLQNLNDAKTASVWAYQPEVVKQNQEKLSSDL